MPARVFPNLGLKGGYDEHEAGWGDDQNLNLLILSVLSQGTVEEKLAAVPGVPVPGMVILLDETNVGNPNAVAVFEGPVGAEAWTYIEPKEGWLLYNQDAGYYEKFDGAVWDELATGGSGGISDAPSDGELYGRKDAAWEIISGGGGGGGGSVDGYYCVPPLNANASATAFAQDNWAGRCIIVPHDGQITHVVAPVNVANGASRMTPAIYLDTGAGLGALAATGPNVVGAADGLNDLPLDAPLAVTAGQILWVGMIVQDSGLLLMANAGTGIAYFVEMTDVAPDPAPAATYGGYDGSPCFVKMEVSVASGGGSATVQTEAADYTLAPGDVGNYIRLTGAGTKDVEIDPDATTALPANGEWHIRNVGAGDATIVPGAGVTVNLPAGGSLTLEQGMTVTLKSVAVDELDLLGQTA